MVALPRGESRGASGAPRRTLSGRFSSGHLVMIVAGLLGMVLGIAALRHEPDGVDVAVAAHEIRAGESVTADDFRSGARADVERACSPRSCGPATFAGCPRPDRRRRRSQRGEPVIRRELRPRAAKAGLRAMSIPIDPSRAVGGRLATGDRIDVLFAGDHEVSIIVRDAEVIAIDAKGRGGIGETSSPFTVTIAVDAASRSCSRRRSPTATCRSPAPPARVSSQGTAPQSLDRVGAACRRHRAVGARVEPTIALGLLARTLGRDDSTGTSPTTAAHACARSCSSRRWRWRTSTTRSSSVIAGRGSRDRFVDAVHHRSRCVLGVFDPDEAAGREHLVALGVDAHDSLRRRRLGVRRSCSPSSRRHGSPEPATAPTRRHRSRTGPGPRSSPGPRARARAKSRSASPRRSRLAARPRSSSTPTKLASSTAARLGLAHRAEPPQRHRRGRARPRRPRGRARSPRACRPFDVRVRAPEPGRGRADPAARRARRDQRARRPPLAGRRRGLGYVPVSRSLARWSPRRACSSASVAANPVGVARLLGWAAALPAGVVAPCTSC